MFQNIKFISRIFIIAISLFGITNSYAQPGTNPDSGYIPPSHQQIINSIYQKYDSLPNLTFDVKYTMTSDTVNGKFLNDVLQGTYTMAGKNALYNLGDIDFMQNDSFFISVYNKENFILVADPATANAGNGLPMRAGIDSLFQTYSAHYTISDTTVYDQDSTSYGTIKFVKSDSLAQFESFSISYNNDQKLLSAIEYTFKELEYPEETADSTFSSFSSSPVLRRKTLKIEFYNYRFDRFEDALYSENNYIFFENGVCKPVEKYRDFRIFYSRTGIRTYQKNAHPESINPKQN